MYDYRLLPFCFCRQGTLLQRLRQDATLYIMNSVPYGSYFGIVTFSGSAEIKHPVSLVQNATDIDRLIDALPDQAYGTTCIGCGLKDALKVSCE